MFLRSKKHGKGTYYYNNGDIYDGEWEENYRSGKGELNCKKGDLCKGDFAHDELVSGIYVDINGSTYKN